jgi:TonB family protein
MRFGTVQNVMMRICVDADGHVTSTKILSGIGGAADDGVAATVAQWRFAPYAVQGRPVPFCYVSRFVFTPG